jgi:glutathione S-transferase
MEDFKMLTHPDIKKAPVPFFLRPITNGIASKIETSYLNEQFRLHYNFLEDQLSTSPNTGEYLCGKDITGADILMSFALEAGNRSSGFTQEEYPKVFAYVDRLYQREAYKRATEKIVEVEGQFRAILWIYLSEPDLFEHSLVSERITLAGLASI